MLANALRPKTKYATVIGSYGWAGKTVETLVGRAADEHPAVRRAQVAFDVARLETEKARAQGLPTSLVLTTSANGVAHNIQHILSVTEHTQQGTEQTARSIRQLALLAQELKNSVSRFRVVA